MRIITVTVFRQKHSGNMLAVRVRLRLTAMAMRQTGTTCGIQTIVLKLRRSVLSCLIRGVCTICTAMCTNGARIGMTNTTTLPRPTLRGLMRALSACCAAAAGTVAPGAAAPRIATTPIPTTLTPPSGSAWWSSLSSAARNLSGP